MLSICGAGGDSWESLEVQLNQPILREINPEYSLKYWCWSANTLATWYKQLTHWKRPWCWERMRARGGGSGRGWDGLIASLTQWTWICSNSEIVQDHGAWCAAAHGVTKNWIWLSSWTIITTFALILTACKIVSFWLTTKNIIQNVLLIMVKNFCHDFLWPLLDGKITA